MIAARISALTVVRSFHVHVDEDFQIDRGGAINVIAPKGLTSKHAGGQATSGYLANVERVSMAQMEEWMQKYPEAFAREYDPACGLMFNNWVIKEA